MKKLCIYHGNCADGFTAAWVVRRALGEDVEFHAGVYQNPPPDVTGRDVILVDFSYKRPVLEEMAKVAHSILILDHHKSAVEDLEGFGIKIDWSGWESYLELLARDESEHACSIYQQFDMTRSGAGIVWDFFFPGRVRPFLVNAVEDRDLWKFALPESRAYSAAVFSYEYTFENWDLLFATHPSILIAGGHAIERKHHKDVAELVKVCARELEIGGHKVLVASLPYTLTSDAGHLMAKGKPFAACYWDKQEGREFSLRSTDEGLDVSEIAKMYGGGGHRNAAGFRVPRDHELARA